MTNRVNLYQKGFEPSTLKVVVRGDKKIKASQIRGSPQIKSRCPNVIAPGRVALS